MLRYPSYLSCFSLVSGLVLWGLSASALAELPEGWFDVGDNHPAYENVVAEDAGREGPGFRVRSVKESQGFGGVGQRISAMQYRNQRVSWSAHIKTRDVEQWTGLWMRIDGGNREVLAFDNMRYRGLTGDTDWEEHAVVLDVPEEAHAIVFGVLLSGEGEVRLDGLRFDVVEDDVEVTGDDLPLRPRNLDF